MSLLDIEKKSLGKNICNKIIDFLIKHKYLLKNILINLSILV